MKFSVNTKSNAVMSDIADSLFTLWLDKDYDNVISELTRYKNEHCNATDYNIVNDANLLIYYEDIRKLFKDNGYQNDHMSDNYIYLLYKRFVRRVVDTILSNKEQFKKDYFE